MFAGDVSGQVGQVEVPFMWSCLGV